jgi:hypothetical protein
MDVIYVFIKVPYLCLAFPLFFSVSSLFETEQSTSFREGLQQMFRMIQLQLQYCFTIFELSITFE